MLKIRDDIDLKELEKYGFKNNFCEVWERDLSNEKNDKYKTSILVNPLYGEIDRMLVYYTNNKVDPNELELDEEDIDLCGKIDILYDLIKDGLVEKVEE